MKEIKKLLTDLEAQGVKSGIITDPDALSFKNFKAWIDKGGNGVLSYLEGERGEKRESIKRYFPNFKSALVLAFDYSKAASLSKDFYESKDSNGFKIANYVLGFDGVDYHYSLRNQLEEISKNLKTILPNVEIMHSLDTQPILERDMALKAGLGWFGKNSMLINQEIGSYFILGTLFLDVDLSSYIDENNSIDTDHCGSCTKCIDACPTDAIDAKTRTLIANKCISTFTIELFKDAKAPSGMEKGTGEIFGCDICQDVCPWNTKKLKSYNNTGEEMNSFLRKNENVFSIFLKPKINEIISNLESLSNREYRRIFKSTPLERTGRIGMLKNLKFYKKD